MPKTLPSRDGAGSASAATVETPSSAGTLPAGSFAPPFTDTEVEEVNGIPGLKPGEADKEVSNPKKAESALVETETVLEDPGSEAAEETAAMDALFASYSELLPQARVITEVIIGTDDRVRVNPTTSFPWRAICALKITAQNNTHWIGTGWMVGPRTVMTAGHCVYMHDQGGWAKSIEVIPACNGSVRPYGSAVSSDLRSVVGWTQNKNRDNDYGAIILPANKRLGDQTGYFGYAVKDDSYLMSAILNLAGYPGDKPGGNEQWFMALKTKSVSARVITYDIDTVGGQSGAPVWIKVGDARYCVGIHTNGASSGNSATRIVTAVFNNIQAWKAQGS